MARALDGLYPNGPWVSLYGSSVTGVGFADLLIAAEATGASVTIHTLDDYEVNPECRSAP